MARATSCGEPPSPIAYMFSLDFRRAGLSAERFFLRIAADDGQHLVMGIEKLQTPRDRVAGIP